MTPQSAGVVQGRWARWLDESTRDLRLSTRTLAKHPLLSAAVIGTLGLAIGVNTAVFSLVDALLLRTLPVRAPHELVFLRVVGATGQSRGEFPYAVFEAWREGTHTLSGIVAFDESRVSASIDGESEMLDGDFVSGTYFDVLGIVASAGRTLRAGDDQPGSPPVAMISDAFWSRRFSRDPMAIGKTIRLGDLSVTIIGITPPAFFGRRVAGPAADVVLPMSTHARLRLSDHDVVQIMGRLASTTTASNARAELNALYRVSAKTAVPRLGGVVREAEPERVELVSALHGDARLREQVANQLHILLGVGALVLLIACVNVANLLLARGAARRKEVAARLALGASRARVVRQLLMESVVLAVAGSVLGVLIANLSAGALLAILTEGDPATLSAQLDRRVLLFSLGVTVLTALLCGAVPAAVSTRLDLSTVLRGGGDVGGPHSVRSARSLIVPQIALSLALTVAAGMLVRTVRQLNAVETGFERQRVLTTWMFPVLAGYDHARERLLYDRVLGEVGSMPGVQAASLSRYSLTRGFKLGIVSPRFFETMGIPIQRGRDFAPSDDEDSPRVAILSARLARKLFPGQNAIGQMLSAEQELAVRLPADSGRPHERVQVIGIAGDIRQRKRQQGWDEIVFIPLTQSPNQMLGQVKLLVRANRTPAAMITPLREAVRSAAPDVPLIGLQTQEQELDAFMGEERSLAGLVSGFGALALALATLGLYGTAAYAVRRRTRELGIRLALGAQRSAVVWMVVRETLPMVALGVAGGLVLALVAGRLLAATLFGVGAVDPVSMALTVMLMTLLTLAATIVPARRAARIDPLRALREE